ncbi:M20 family metallopeptidase [Candidatus Lokiarchaeum ossiferum]|uniref:M20 family metallopeptidase n=1 Tax=Candidatus Lokiarchaeum ossiferum TaxID=2951803 RepID=UPI00352FD568
MGERSEITVPDVISLTQQFVRLETENGHEDRMVKVIEVLLEPFGFQFFTHELSPGRRNFFALWESSSDVDLILFSGHMDTVPGYHINHSDLAELKDNRIFGRGTCDMKGGIAAYIVASLQFLQQNQKNLQEKQKGILLGFTVDEEDGCQGVDHLEESLEILQLFKRVSFCILAEPSMLQLHIGHKGINRYKVTFKGKAAHSSVPEQGINAIYMAADYIHTLRAYFQEIQEISSPIGNPKLSVGTINGGTATNVVPAQCVLTIDRRYVPGENPVEDEMRFKSMAELIDPNVIFESSVVGWPYYLPDGEKNPLVLKLSSLLDNAPVGHLPAYTEADLYFRKYNLPTIILGPGDINQAHKTPEYVSIAQLHLAVTYYTRIIQDFVDK